MIDRPRTFWIGAAVLCLLLCACVKLKQPSLKIDYYTLEYDFPRFTDFAPTPGVIRVERFSVAPMYNTVQIIYRNRAFQRESYYYHKWRSNPGDLVTYFLARDMRESGLFRAVLPRDSNISAAYAVGGSVDEFFEWDMGEVCKAVLTLTITLVAESEPNISKRVLIQKTYRTQEASRGMNPAALAEAMSRGMAKVSGEIIRDIYHALHDN